MVSPSINTPESFQSGGGLPAPSSSPARRLAKTPNGDPEADYNPPGTKNTDSCLPLRKTGPVMHNYACEGPAPGDITLRWIHGSVVAARNTDPRVQVIAYNEDTYILRQNPCVHWEAPFTYLLFGNKGALLIDTGATPEPAYYPLRASVDALVQRWCRLRRRKTISLTVVLTSGEDVSQHQGLPQFAERPETTLAPINFAAAKQFHGLNAWPTGTGKIDLGDRVITVIPTPGTHKDGITFYDSYNKLLHTGDLLYPGRIMIANDRDYVASLARLKEWSDSHPVKWVMGGHIEMMFVPGRAYPRFRNHREFEHVLQLEPKVIAEALTSAASVMGQSKVVFREEFILLNRVGPDEQVYRTGADMPDIPVPFWLP